MIGVCKKSLYRWERSGKIQPAFRTAGNHRRYDRRVILVLIRQWGGDGEGNGDDEVSRNDNLANAAIYARVSSTRQKQSGDLDRQASTLASYCEGRGFRVSRVYSDVGSGINDGRRGLLKLLKDVARGYHDAVVVNYQDRLSRFGVNVIREFLSSWWWLTSRSIQMILPRSSSRTSCRSCTRSWAGSTGSAGGSTLESHDRERGVEISLILGTVSF